MITMIARQWLVIRRLTGLGAVFSVRPRFNRERKGEAIAWTDAGGNLRTGVVACVCESEQSAFKNIGNLPIDCE